MAGARLRFTRLAAAVSAALAAALLAPGASWALGWHACPHGTGAACATLRVPLDRTGAPARTVPLKVARLRSAATGSVLVYLSGGPGGAGIEEARAVIPLVPGLRARYRVIGFDQRGTGGSGLLRCPRLERDVRLRDARAGADCAARIGPARRHYTTPDSVEDLEAIRRALGVEKLTLFGISYGTELALAYARAHPGRVDRLILDSVVDPDDRDPFGLAGFRAMGPSLAGLCPARCRGLSPSPIGDLAVLAARLEREPMHGLAYDRHGRAHSRSITATALADLLYDSDYNPPLRAGVPVAVRAALAGDAAPLARLTREGDGLATLPAPRSFSSARYATVCEETPLPWDPGTPIADRPRVTRQRAAALGAAAFAPFDPETAAADEIGLCLHWPGVPSGIVPAPAAPYPAVPALILQGGEDLRTPPEGSARVAAALPGVERVVVPGVGHAVVGGDPSGCGVRVLARFVAGERVGGDCPRVGTGVPAILPAPRSVRRLAPAGGLHGRVGRTVAALGYTLDDLAFSLSPAFLGYSGGGLRGGSFAVRDGRLVLHRYVAVRGVAVSGVTRRGLLRMRVGGAGAAHGRVTLLAGGRLRGRLGGRPIRLRLARTASAAPAPNPIQAPSASGRGSLTPAALAANPLTPAALAASPLTPAALAASPLTPAALTAVFRAPFARKSSHLRLVPAAAR